MYLINLLFYIYQFNSLSLYYYSSSLYYHLSILFYHLSSLLNVSSLYLSSLYSYLYIY